ncbi:unnamed protein product [Paramecium pentaurelia]|uniref:Uncharacterized protein n=1 Tax=Paramecium pentaurelia TaxID=43138 RepID=A0A8S1TQ70_9CILI|nr:unnamed protein product [Paramecium pentaurelia]
MQDVMQLMVLKLLIQDIIYLYAFFVQPYCAEFFSYCNYNGESFVICNNNPDLLQRGWTKSVKSLMNFTQKKLYLFNQINYQGQEQKIIQNQQCMESQSIISVKLQSLTSAIKVIFINSNLNNNNSKYVYFYSQCNYQGTVLLNQTVIVIRPIKQDSF